MKKQIKYKKSFLLVLALFYLMTLPQNSEDLKDRPDSIRFILGITVDDSSIEELPGKDITEFRFYTSANTSTILWKYEKNYYSYLVTDRLVAMKLFDQLQEKGIATFIAKRQGNKIRFHEYRQVIAIQLKGSKK